MQIQVIRECASSTFDAQFFEKEKRVLESIEGVSYTRSLHEISSDMPYVLLTTPSTDLSLIPKAITENSLLIVHPYSQNTNIEKSEELKSIPVITGNPIRTHAVTEYVLGCLFRKFTPIPNSEFWEENASWDRPLIRDQKIVILGYGHIGKLIYQCLTPLNSNIYCIDPRIDTNVDDPFFNDRLTEEVIKDADVIIISARYDESAKHLIDANVLDRISPEGLLINISEGNFVNEKDLEAFMQRKPHYTAYLDVFESEPFPPGYLSEVGNLNKSSHIAGSFKRLNNDIISFEYLVLSDFINSIRSDSLGSFNQDYKDCILSR